ncbi:MAG: hypothetical protein ABEH78_01680 [Haloferacaceae archaeon]
MTAAQIGGGEALSVPVIASHLGMGGIWLIPLVGFTKIFGQYFLVSHAVITGRTFMDHLHDRPWWLRWMFFYTLLGGWSGSVFLLAISLALFTSMYAPAYGISRFWEDSFGYMNGFERFDVRRTTFFRLCLGVFVTIPLALNLLDINPLLLFSVGGILFAPIIALLYLVALYLLFSDVEVASLRPRSKVLVTLALVASFPTLLSSLLSI